MLNFEDKEWKPFRIYYIFSHQRGKRQIEANRKKGNIPYYSASQTNNGLTDFISNPTFKINTNAIIYSTFGDAYYTEKDFSTSDEITILTNSKLNKFNGLFISKSINQNKSKYSFGRKAFSNKIDKDKIILPINENKEPDYNYMEEYSKSIIDSKTKKYRQYAQKVLNSIKYKNIETLENKDWKEFFLIDIFTTIQRGKRLTKQNQTKGNIPYISSTSLNNGVDNFIGNKTDVRIFSDCLTIANSGSVGASFYQPYNFVGSDHITHLKKENMNKYVYIFISTLTNRFSEKYNFNREINDKRISREKIMLPINDRKEPDFEYMEQYMKNLTYKKVNQYLSFINYDNLKLSLI
ncbi:restriction endonuclease subunit S [Aliarcobacter butzleri]|uniref:restriction endonuclease subunit S n=1 Tax=Aliarcobacter butzleri TaxID=28197 RepID=UPI00186AB4FC|nr:restriction endonuclease subunit S [Aliarcobacter butzleri]